MIGLNLHMVSVVAVLTALRVQEKRGICHEDLCSYTQTKNDFSKFQ